MTAFYMFRLIFMTFYGEYRGPSWDDGHSHDHAGDGHDSHAWHGPHESPRAMTVPLIALAVGAVVAGYIGIPAALGEWAGIPNAIEHFLEPSFVAGESHPVEVHHLSHAAELGLMVFSVLVAFAGILLAARNYLQRPEIAERWAKSYAGPHELLTNKYYVDEFYGATFVAGTMASAHGLFVVDRKIVDGAVSGTGWFTVLSSWASHMADKYVVDGLVNLVGNTFKEGSFTLRRVQTGLIQNYAFATLLGVAAFVTWYLIGS